MIDLRSDTVTRPTAGMRAAMHRAEVGDDGRLLPDGRSGDPTVNALEERAAELLGKPAALLLPSGTMANLVALRTWCPRGAPVAVGTTSHLHRRETSAFDEQYLGLRPVLLDDRSGLPSAEELRAAREIDAPRLLCLENTHNAACGMAWEPGAAAPLLRAAAGMPVHLDGARLFNAAVALDRAPRELAAGADSLMFCLTKGLGAPFGALLLGGTGFIARAREVRKLLGGQLRQVGVAAAAGLVALGGDRGWLADDHRRAARLAAGLAGLRAAEVATAPVPTNIVQVRLPGAAPGVIGALAERGVLVQSPAPGLLRLVTHRDLTDTDIDRGAAALRAVLDHPPRTEEP